jgi:UDP-N-acetylmuramate: L-alanyl-gamma-D-glutamyl-meso-diaminopimelate ligase
VTRFEVRRTGSHSARSNRRCSALHNVRNALAAIAVATHAGADVADVARAARVSRDQAAAGDVGVGAASRCSTISHIIRPRAETLAALRTGYPIGGSGPCSSRAPPRRAGVFQDDFARAFEAADRSSSPVCPLDPARVGTPLSRRLVDDLHRNGQHARYIPEVDDIIRTIVAEHRDGDVVVLMSNGGFGGIHRKLLQALVAGTGHSTS